MSTVRGTAPATDIWTDWYELRREQVEGAFAAHFDEIRGAWGPHSRLPAAVEYSVGSGGKRFRPVLVLECCQLCGGHIEQALPAALAVECVHAFSLIHDDLPALDNDDLRRGKPSNHKMFGEGLALLAGDWLLTHAVQLLASGATDESLRATLIATLVDGTLGMIEGQAADVENEGRSAEPNLVEYIHLHKTGRLIEASCRLGALCAMASEDEIDALARFGRHLGVAFQITDDVLDRTGTSEKLGKHVAKDAGSAKQTYPAAFGMEASRRQAEAEIESALRALERFGEAAGPLRGLARYVIARDH